MEEFKNILYPVALTDISSRIAPYVVTMAKQLDAQVHLLHVLRRFGVLEHDDMPGNAIRMARQGAQTQQVSPS